MTIEEMRKEMRREVVPEEVVPQNVISRLIDEDAEPPKLDAFSFLMRLRALGIGSEDFVNLLEGCDAPESVVSKIKANPAMNLQGLILTLDNSELNSDDYTRMLLTARQVWERTLTLRLEKSEKLSQEIQPEDGETDDEPVKIYGEAEDIAEEQTENDTEPAEDIGEEMSYDEDLLDMSFTDILESINAKVAAELQRAEAEEISEEVKDTEYTEDSETQDVPDSDTELSFSQAFDKIKSRKQVEEHSEDEPEEISDIETSEDTGTVDLISIDEKVLRENFGVTSDEPEDTDGEEEDEADEAPEELPKTAKQKKAKDEELPEDNDEDEDGEDEADEENENDNAEKPDRVYHKGFIIGAAAGAAVLIGAGVLVGHLVGGKNENGLHYASDNSEIFTKIRHAYSDFVPGGSAAVGLEEDTHAIFGDLLISNGDGKKAENSFTIGAGHYALTEEAISVSMVENGSAMPLEDLLPPEDSRFVAAFDSDGELYALFSGKQSGFMKISNGAALYTVRQDGMLTDYDFSDGEIKLGTVYTPVFRQSFTQNDEAVYLPKLGAGEEPISVKKVIVSGTDGYSYGVSASYSVENGQVNNACAIIGDPVAASADGRFALNGDKGLLVKTKGNKITSQQTEKLTHAAFGKNGCAIAEEAETAEQNGITLLDINLNTAALLTGVTGDISVMRFDGDFLTISGAGNSVYGVDCSDLSTPEPIMLKTVNGVIAGQSAITCEASGNAILITRYDLSDGRTVKVGEYSGTLTAGKPEAVKPADAKTAVIDGAQSGIAYSYFDGVSVMSEYAVFGGGAQPKTVSVFDDKTGFTVAFKDGNAIKAVCADGVKVLQ